MNVIVFSKYSYFYLVVAIGLAVFERWKRSDVFSDEELLRKYADTADNQYFAELFKRYTHLVYGICMRYLKDADKSKDAVMQIFEKLMSDLKTRQIENFSHWIKVVAKNHCLMELRRNNPMISMSGEENFVLSFVENNHDLHLIEDTEQNIQLLEKAISELAGEQQTCIKLFYLEEKTYAEVAGITGFTLNQVKSYIQNGKRNLYLYMTRNNAH